VCQLCSHKQDIDNELNLFFQRLVNRGHSPATILPLLKKAELKARERVAHERESIDDYIINKDKLDMRDQIFFHLPFHPSNPNSAAIQKIWQENIASPLKKTELLDLKNHWGHKIAISKLTVAYSRGPNLRNLLSCRKLKTADRGANNSEPRV
jgi:hypothetical protein